MQYAIYRSSVSGRNMAVPHNGTKEKGMLAIVEASTATYAVLYYKQRKRADFLFLSAVELQNNA